MKNEEKVEAQAKKIKEFLAEAEVSLAMTLKKQMPFIRSQIATEIYSTQVKIHIGLKTKGCGDIIIHLSPNFSKKDNFKFRITEIFVPGFRRDFNKEEDRDGLIIAGKLTDKLGDFGYATKKVIEEYDKLYTEFERLSNDALRTEEKINLG